MGWGNTQLCLALDGLLESGLFENKVHSEDSRGTPACPFQSQQGELGDSFRVVASAQ